MQVKALIFEQLEGDGTLRTFKMMSDNERPLVVALSNEYDEPRIGPVFFLDDSYETAYDKGFATAKVRKTGSRRFYQTERGFHFDTSWIGIPTERGSLTYYVLMLPEYAIPISIRLFDPHSDRDYRKTVIRDDLRKRFNVYLACRSSKGLFDFVLQTEFEINYLHFKDAPFSDEYNDESGWRIDYHDWLDSEESEKVQQFFWIGDISGSNGVAIGRGASATVTTGLSGSDAAQLFQAIYSQIQARPSDPRVEKDEIQDKVEKIEQEAKAGAQANEGKLGRWLRELAGMAPDIFDVTVTYLANPMAGFAEVVKKVAAEAKEAKS